MNELIPCPFCGRKDGFQVKPVWKSFRFVACQCKAAGPVMKTDEEAVKAWNNRPEKETGVWIGGEYDGYADGYPVYDTFFCSECNEEWDADDVINRYAYCPNCGSHIIGYANGTEGGA